MIAAAFGVVLLLAIAVPLVWFARFVLYLRRSRAWHLEHATVRRAR